MKHLLPCDTPPTSLFRRGEQEPFLEKRDLGVSLMRSNALSFIKSSNLHVAGIFQKTELLQKIQSVYQGLRSYGAIAA
ncbi:hypothetical protein BIY37_12665 [Candidatus Brocadia sapporoensis]|uniref:Uncharacterized protein n=1 Tax=Candidatus Brocadia sapporoensis TaxID=392547 RepID=A0A1V6LWK3_9BACT|nr:hypothetical protein BIY37_12665 [Candidatus Brocadia sapporoensis]